ncbi:CIC11C00000001943 [Sungouiella intermedia]|uniref:CIC11C00000001943 n=1 Tax=Sungouiella intermedia TaxID=45354 RepID=A0A1L0BM71_9ASCO|nr:CIC11C00000001943 [[Candida] intermedia]
MEKERLLPSHNEEESAEAINATSPSLFSNIFSCLPTYKKNDESHLDEMIAADDPLDHEPLPHLPPSLKVESSLNSGERLTKLRQLMKDHGISVYLVPSEDEHQSEETGLSEKRREFLCGFTGSAGICVVTLDSKEELEGEAALSTDGRYFLQAEQQLDPKYWRLLKQGMAGYPTWEQFAFEKAAESKFSNVISCDPKLLSLYKGEYFTNMLKHKGVQFKTLLETNLVDEVWGPEKPSRPTDPVYSLPLDFAGETTSSKLLRVREYLADKEATHLLITALDDIGWLLNLRSDVDIPFSPFFYSYVIVTGDSVVLYAQDEKLKNVREHLGSIKGLTIKPYGQFYGDLSMLKTTISKPDIKMVLPSKNACNYALVNSLPQSSAKQGIIYDSVVATMKLFKNPTELFNAKIAQSKDSLAFIVFSAWLENQLIHKKAKVDEWQAAQKIYSIRSKLPNFKGLSYETISSSGPNAAIIHYAPSPTQHSVIDPTVPYLIDSGAHYLEGTTDITRTYKFGYEGLTKEYKKFYTLVLKGHLAVAMAKFPAGSTSTGAILDAYARQPLWNEGLDFNHGTGHGVGSFGNVHEGPLYISTTAGGASHDDLFKKGAILTDEPGYYVDGEYGFRVESELEIVETDDSFGKTRSGGKYLGFNYLTKVPFCRKLIDAKYLAPVEITWINEFHLAVKAEFGPKLLRLGDKRAYAWLVKETAPI